MSFTTAQTLKIREYLGYPQVYKQANPRLEGAIVTLGTDTDAVTEVTSILSELATIESNISSRYATAGIKKVDEVEFFGGRGDGTNVISSQRSLGRRHVARLSILFGVPIASDVFGETGYGGDGWSSAANQYGGLMPL